MAEIDRLIEEARHVAMNAGERAAQRRSFAFGSSKIENDRITRDTVTRAEDELVKLKQAAQK